MRNIQSIDVADLVIVSSNEIIAYQSLGSFYDTQDGVFYYVEEFENAENKGDYISKLNYCEFVYLLFYWNDNSAKEFAYLSENSANILKSYRELDFPDFSSDFFEFHWFNSYCQFENIIWHPDFAWGIGDNGDIFLLNIDWHEHTFYVKQDLFEGMTKTLENIKKEVILNMK